MRTVVLASVGVMLGVAWEMYARRNDESGERDGLGQAINEGFSYVSAAAGGLVLKLDKNFNFLAQANMRKLRPNIEQVRKNANVAAFMHVIRHKEHLPQIAHTTAAYNVMCGGKTFTSFRDHPRPKLPRPCGRGASGAYQITEGTWDELVRETGLNDFSPVNQDRGAVYRMAYRGAVNDVLAGNLRGAVSKCRNEWTSLPGASEDHTGYTYQMARDVFVQYGGTLAAGN